MHGSMLFNLYFIYASLYNLFSFARRKNHINFYNFFRKMEERLIVYLCARACTCMDMRWLSGVDHMIMLLIPLIIIM